MIFANCHFTSLMFVGTILVNPTFLETFCFVHIWSLTSYRDNEDVHDLGSIETECPNIFLNDMLTSEATLSCKPTVSSLNNDEIDFKISFDEFDDEDCTENDNDKVNMPLLPSPAPTVSYFDNLDFFKDFENEFLAIVYNDAQTSKSDLLVEPTLCTQHIDEYDLKEETSLSEYDKEEQNVLNFNDLFLFNVIYPNDSKSDKDNDDDDDDKVDIEHSSGDMSVIPLSNIADTAYPNPMDTAYSLSGLIMKYLVNISNRRAFWSLNEDILKINDYDNQYAISNKEDTTGDYSGVMSPLVVLHVVAIRSCVKTGTPGWKGLPDGGDVRMEGVSRWKARPDGRDIRMEGTSGWKARPDGRHVRMEGTPGWKGRLDERHTALTP
nr:hypothetical protein [Tanacetum cinerariifolium]